jgi:hypothetical protein
MEVEGVFTLVVRIKGDASHFLSMLLKK